MLGKEEVFVLTVCLTVGCLGGSPVPGTAGTRYMVTKAGHLFSLECRGGRQCLQTVRSRCTLWPSKMVHEMGLSK